MTARDFQKLWSQKSSSIEEEKNYFKGGKVSQIGLFFIAFILFLVLVVKIEDKKKCNTTLCGFESKKIHTINK